MGFPIIHQPSASTCSCWPPRNSKTLKYYGTEEPSSQYKRGEIMVTIVSRGPPLASESTTLQQDAMQHFTTGFVSSQKPIEIRFLHPRTISKT